MVDCPSGCETEARRPQGRRAFNLIELVSVLVIIGLLAATGFMRYGSSTVQNLAGEGFARKLALDLMQARRRTIATGDNHYLLMAPSAANVTSYKMFRRAAGGDVAVDETKSTPAGVTCSTSHITLEFDFDGSALAAYSVSILAPNRTWTVSTVMATGTVQTATTT